MTDDTLCASCAAELHRHHDTWTAQGAAAHGTLPGSDAGCGMLAPNGKECACTVVLDTRPGATGVCPTCGRP